MLAKVGAKAKRILRSTGIDVVRSSSPVQFFHSDLYLRHNARRLEHLASLRIPVAGMSVLEVGAGIGDHTHYYIDRGCKITITEARPQNLRHLRKRYPQCNIQSLDMESPTTVEGSPFDLVHCYGLLYHLSNPKQALAFLSRQAKRMMFLETFVAFGTKEEITLAGEDRSNPTQAVSGTGCRPTRAWLFTELKALFQYVYLPKTQPCHEEFPLDWTAPEKHQSALQRAIFIASREPLENDQLTPSLVLQQTRQP
jgi:2-polyprenyl-3-methyl-5-hydroxy-6-metoxy-1,4-benzoquinol methylase